MATETPEGYFSLPAAADFSAGQSRYRGVVINTAGQVALAGAGVYIDGILKNEPKQGEQARFEFYHGVHKGRAGAAFGAGVDLAVNANGEFVEAAGEDTVVVAKSIDAATAAGSHVRVLYTGYRGVIGA